MAAFHAGRGRTQGPGRGEAAFEDNQRVSLQLTHGAIEADGIKVALSMGKPRAAPVAEEAKPSKAGQHLCHAGLLHVLPKSQGPASYSLLPPQIAASLQESC